jgi:mycofactocin precursor
VTGVTEPVSGREKHMSENQEPEVEVAEEVVEEDLLVEDVSIDGMCGVY